MKAKKILKSVFSFLLVLCIMCGLVGNYVPGGTVEAEMTASSYTVTLNGNALATGSTYKSHFFLGNAETTDGTVTLSYTVQEVKLDGVNTDTVGQNGVTALTKIKEDWPASNGSSYVNRSTNYFMKVGCTYTLTLGLNASTGKITFDGYYVDASGTRVGLPVDIWASNTHSGTASFSHKYFGITFSNDRTGLLTNVTCVDENGKDLGLASNQSSCVIEKNAEEIMPTSYRVALNGNALATGTSYKSHFFLGNSKTTDGKVTLSYTVQEVKLDGVNTDAVGQNGVTALTKIKEDWPASTGSSYINSTTNYFMKVGCTYTLTLGLHATKGQITFDGYYVDASGTQVGLPVSVWASNTHSGTASLSHKYFGITFSRNCTGILTNVTCVDENGKDLGLASNQSSCVITKEKNPMIMKFTDTQFATYRSANKTYPTAPDGYVFAGWYSDKTCSTALKTNTIDSTATAYAKYVDADVLSVKYQLPANASMSDGSTTLRLVTTVDSLQYRFVGFKINIGGDPKGAYKTKDVYDTITGTMDSKTVTYKPYVFSSESEYFMAVEITGVPNEVFSQTITVIPAWETLDGTVVEANARQDIVIANAMATLEQ